MNVMLFCGNVGSKSKGDDEEEKEINVHSRENRNERKIRNLIGKIGNTNEKKIFDSQYIFGILCGCDSDVKSK